MWKKYLFLCVTIILGYQVVAQDATKTNDLYDSSLSDLLNMTVVSASKKSEKLTEAPSNIAVITSKQIKEWGSRDIKDVLRRVAGYQVIADRDEWVFAGRGNVSDNNQKYLILIDGHKMNSMENFGPGNIIELPNNLANVKQIEIIKGPGSAVWGADALAGVINIITMSVDDLKSGNGAAGISYGSNNFQTYDFQVGQKVSDDASILISGSMAKQDGRMVKQNVSSGFPIIEGYDYYTNSLKTDSIGYYHTRLSEQHLSHMFQVKANVGNFTLNALTFETNVNNRHFESEKGRENLLTTTKSFLEFGYNKTFNKLQFSAKVGTDINLSDYQPLSLDTLLTKKLPSSISWRDHGFIVSAEALYSISDKLSLNSGIEYRSSKLGPNPRIDSINSSLLTSKVPGLYVDKYLEDDEIGAYLMLNYKPIDKLSIIAGGRASNNDKRGDDAFKFNPRVALIYSPIKDASIKAIFNTGYLRPANFQAVSSTNVSSESMTQFDLIWMHSIGKLNYSINYYQQTLKGFIALTSNGGYDYQNLGTYSSSGVEIDLNYYATRTTSIWANASITNAKGSDFASTLPAKDKRVDMDGRLLSFAPYVVNGGFTQTFLDGKITLSPAIRFIGETKYRVINPVVNVPDEELNYRTTPNFVSVDCNIMYMLNKNFTFSIYGDNLLDVRTATNMTVWNGTIEQYGRFLYGKLQFTF